MTKQNKQRLLIIDANSLIHRAYHALPPLSTQKGELVNAVYGFLLVFFKAIKDFKPTYIAAAFDMAAPTQRHKKFAGYKATRAKAADELYAQMPKVKEVLDAFHVPWYEQEGFEADDIIGTIATKALKKQAHPALEVIIATGDMDALQLVNEHTKVFTLKKGVKDTIVYDIKAVQKRFGSLAPKQLDDYKGLRGDPSDNIPGVPGIGEKTAIELLVQFGSLETIYKELQNSGIKPSVAEKLRLHKDQAFLSRELALINTDVPMHFQMQDLAWESFDKEQAIALVKSFDFQSLVPKIAELKGEQGDQDKESAHELIDRMEEQGVLSEHIAHIERELTKVLRTMEATGIAIDVAYFAKLEKELAKELAVLEKGIHAKTGQEFNIASPAQLSQILFEKLGLSTKRLKKTPGGAISTASSELEKLTEVTPIAQEVLSWRELQKLLTTYVKPLPALADAQGRVHTHFDQLGAATGRMSSSDPNLQNIPMQGSWGKKIRKGFIAQAGYTLVSFDYSQMELRIAAHMAKEDKMKAVFEKNQDIHTMTAAEVFGIQEKDVTPEMRYRAKALNFGVLYGMGARGFAQSAGIPYEQAQDFIDQYFIRFPAIAEFAQDTIAFAKEHGYVETMLGRKRYLPDIHSHTPQLRAAAERAAVNHPIQGSLADITKIAMVSIAQQGILSDTVRMLLQIHDELLFEMSGDSIQASRSIEECMKKAAPLSVPVLVDMKQGKNWADMQSIF